MEEISQQNKLTLDEENILNEWLEYYMELTDKSQLSSIVEKVSGEDLNQMIKGRNKHKTINPLVKCILFNKTKFNQKLLKLIDEYSDQISTFNFFNFFKPIIIYHLEKHKSELDELEKKLIIKDPQKFIMENIIQGYNILYEIGYKTLIFEVNYYREQGQLQGESSEERFKYFNNVILNDKRNLEKLFFEYNVLFELLNKKIENYFIYIFDILRNLEYDTKNIEKIINNNEKKIGQLLSIQIGLGDTHKNGKSVAILYFENQKLIYKPQNLGMECAYENLVKWLNLHISKKKYNLLPLSFLKYFCSGDHMWMEFIEHSECKTETEVKNFYRRIGEIIVLLYSLNSTDFHFENIIASGEFPQLIDLETLLRPEFTEKNTDAISKVSHILKKSVASCHILPFNEINNDELFNLSGLGGSKPQKTPYKIDLIKNSNVDTIKIERDFGIINPKNNNPKLRGENIASEKYIKYIKEGFKNMYKFILDNKYEYLNIIEEFFSDKFCRFLVKSTSIYSRLLRSSYHPDILRNEFDRAILLNRIGLLTHDKNSENLLIYEYQELLNGDIPYFSVKTNEPYLYTSKNEKIADFQFDISSIENVKNKINSFSMQDMERQLSIIDCCYLFITIDDDKNYREISLKNGFESIETPFYPNQSRYLCLASTIGKHIIEKGISGIRDNKKDISWYGPFITGKNEIYTNIGNIGFDLYRGNGGIALFLASLYRKTNDLIFYRAAEEAILPLYCYISDFISEDIREIKTSVGAFDGVASILYTLYWVGELIDVNKYKQKSIEFILYLSEKKVDFSKTNLDIISGVCGLLNIALFLYEKSTNTIEQLKLSEAANEFYSIVKNVLVNDTNNMFGCEGNTGFAHGTSGIAATLARLYKATKDITIIPFIQKLLQYDRIMYDEESENWYIDPEKRKVSYGWCHGSSGILLSRILIKEYGYVDDKIDIEIEKALNMTIKYGLGNNNSFCHGDIGNLTILKYVAKSLNDKNLENNCRYTFSKLVDCYISKKWNKPRLGNAEVYSLMVGTAGLGYSLLLNLDSNDLPNILWLN